MPEKKVEKIEAIVIDCYSPKHAASKPDQLFGASNGDLKVTQLSNIQEKHLSSKQLVTKDGSSQDDI